MKNLYEASRTILLFLIMMLFTQVAFGDKAAQKMAVVILFSMVILKGDTVVNYMSSVMNYVNKKDEDENDGGTHKSSAGTTHGGGGGSH